MKTPKEIGALVVIAIMLFMGFIYPLTLILGNQELSNPEISFKLFLFSIILIGGSVGTLVIYFTRYWWKRDNKYGDSFGFYNIGEKPALPFFKNFSVFQLGEISPGPYFKLSFISSSQIPNVTCVPLPSHKGR